MQFFCSEIIFLFVQPLKFRAKISFLLDVFLPTFCMFCLNMAEFRKFQILVETGHIGRQASASVTVTDGETVSPFLFYFNNGVNSFLKEHNGFWKGR